MARQADGVKAERLMKIANEGFADLDQYFVRPRREPAKRLLQNPQPLPHYYVCQVAQVPAKKEINHKEAALKYGGQIYVDYPRKARY